MPQQDCEGKEFERHYRPIGLGLMIDKKGFDLKIQHLQISTRKSERSCSINAYAKVHYIISIDNSNNSKRPDRRLQREVD